MLVWPGKDDKNEWITKLELENIRKKLFQKEKGIEVNNDNTGEWFYQDEENIHEKEATQVDTENLEQKTMIENVLDLMKANSEGLTELIDVYMPNDQRRWSQVMTGNT